MAYMSQYYYIVKWAKLTKLTKNGEKCEKYNPNVLRLLIKEHTRVRPQDRLTNKIARWRSE